MRVHFGKPYHALTGCAHHPKQHEFYVPWLRLMLPVVLRKYRQERSPKHRTQGWNIWAYHRDGRAWCFEIAWTR